MGTVIIDVREKDEFASEHVAGSIHVPLSNLAMQAPGVLNNLKDRKIVIMCRSGKRAQLAKDQLAQMGFDDAHSYEVYPGGILAWKEAGKPVEQITKSVLPIMRQVQLGAGALAFTFSALAMFVNPSYGYGAMFIGAGLMFAGASGFCLMAEILAKMPWNKNRPTLKKELCEVSGGTGKDCQ